jgi:hypothetical protein
VPPDYGGVSSGAFPYHLVLLKLYIHGVVIVDIEELSEHDILELLEASLLNESRISILDL